MIKVFKNRTAQRASRRFPRGAGDARATASGDLGHFWLIAKKDLSAIN